MPRPYTRHPCGIYGPRNLTRRHARRVKNRLLAAAGESVAAEPPKLGPGQEQLFSYWIPSLEAGIYMATVTKQHLVSPSTNETYDLPEQGSTAVQQRFDVAAPRYSLPDVAIHSSFPPQGYGAAAKTLPHVVLSDPHLAWARKASAKPAPGDDDYGRNAVPWLAVVMFTHDELLLSADDLSTLFSKTTLAGKVKQSQTLTVEIPVSDVSKIQSTVSPIANLKPEPTDDAQTQIITVPTALFNELTTLYDTDGVAGKQLKADVSRYKYLAHARDINTTGMPDAGVEDNGVFGIVVSHRTGPLANTQSQAVVAHLISIEGVEDMDWPISTTNTKYVAVTSLYSWNFLTLPEGSFDIFTTLTQLGTTGLGLLRASDQMIDSIDTSTLIGKRLSARLTDGYTMTRYRTSTGEETAAIYRGPFSPTTVSYPISPTLAQQIGLKSCWLSNSGIDLQIMDAEVGLMDITYSIAWQLGKTLAISDQVFTAALSRLRTAIQDKTMASAKAAILQRYGAHQTRCGVADALTQTFSDLNTLHKQTTGLFANGGGMVDRWRRPQPSRLNLSYDSPLIQEIFEEHASAVGAKLMLSPDGDGTDRYDELNTAASVDWMIVLKWVLDKMYLYSVPAHYLIPDPAFLPAETLRFFQVDRNWSDALIDGALSLGNHLGDPDKVRVTIHKMIEDYLNPPLFSSTTTAPPPAPPVYGFMMHSDAVTKYPDLKVTVELAGSHTAQEDAAAIVRLENLDVTQGVMLCLIDQLPGANTGLKSITFTEPPHQQSFIAGATLNKTQITTSYKKIFTKAGQSPDPLPWANNTWTRSVPAGGSTMITTPSDPPPSHPQNVFRWGDVVDDPEIRTLVPTAWTSDVSTMLNWYSKQDHLYVDSVPNAAMAGIQLNNPIYRLKIAVPPLPAPPLPPPSQTPKTSPTEGTGLIGQVVSPFPPTLVSSSTIPVHGESLPGQETTIPHRPREKQAKQAQTPIGSSNPVPRFGAGLHLGPSHGRPSQPPPHFQRTPTVALTPPPSPPPEGGPPSEGGPPIPPTYIFTVLPVDNNPSPGKSGIPGGTGIPQDLVFSILQQTADSPEWGLQKMQLWLQLAVPDSQQKYCLLKGSSYQGPGPFMISNVRFFVLVQVQPPTGSDSNTYLVLSVIPRSTTGSALTAMCKDMSFILPVCDIAPYMTGVGFIPLKFAASYDNGQQSRGTDYHAIQRLIPAG